MGSKKGEPRVGGVKALDEVEVELRPWWSCNLIQMAQNDDYADDDDNGGGGDDGWELEKT